MKETSRIAFENMVSSGSRASMHHKIVNYLSENLIPEGVTASELDHIVGISGAWRRVSELKRDGLIKEQCTRKCYVTKRLATAYVKA